MPVCPRDAAAVPWAFARPDLPDLDRLVSSTASWARPPR